MNENSTHKAKKFLGQHFLKDKYILDKITNACCLNSNDMVVEIGPGKGVLTQRLADIAGSIIAIEKDRQLVPLLKNKFEGLNVEIIQADILKFNWNDLPDNVKLVGNLPYNIATPIIEKAIEYKSKFTEFYFMVQREHAQRLTAKPGSKDYGSLSCFVQYHTQVKSLFNIPPQAFTPMPKIMSSFMSMKFKKTEHSTEFQNQLFRLIRLGFAQRRKMVFNNLSVIYEKDHLQKAFSRINIDLKSRAENVGLDNYIKLTEALN